MKELLVALVIRVWPLVAFRVISFPAARLEAIMVLLPLFEFMVMSPWLERLDDI